MLRITIDEGEQSVVLRLEGKLIGPWVAEVEQCWRRAFSMLGDRSVQVDLSAVSFVDTAGGALLARMYDAGFRLAGTTDEALHEMIRDANAAGAN
jgi:ABC-type transporter Mla MlaB component